MTCLLRVSSQNVDVDTLLVDAHAQPLSVWRKGDRRFPRSTPSSTNGVSFLMSNAEFCQFMAQREDVLTFLHENAAWLRRLGSLHGVEIVADFGVETHPPHWDSFVFEPVLLAALSEAGASLELSVYPAPPGPADHA
ncbi:hypothetical protein [Piscinibacter gummiphilus]|uniref:DUF4279 domain-containing protein n=1 Tax=Piscinibacter gummiphilus TaxID=946333 RepID=A0ABZ0D060_9BURK|nr:hypothetical protein [Piscinibacter gummiphilus]WOB10116.1 hypothetical protein RXV79_08625 [Piscinibacter gummiphilus]